MLSAKKIKRKINKKSQLLLVGSLFILLSISIIGIKHFNLYTTQKDEDNKIKNFYQGQEQIKEIISNNPEEIAEEKIDELKQDNSPKYDYVAVIKIPKINLEKGLAEKGSYYNNVNRNIQIIKESDSPDVEKGNVILASHSGSSSVSYFKNLYKLQNGDLISIFYNGIEYKYKVVNTYDIEKNGTANIIRNKEKNTLTLITCRHNTNKQIVVISELVEKS
ncbi:MAG: sortase [bacterium]|nr:sortase [bacterium]